MALPLFVGVVGLAVGGRAGGQSVGQLITVPSGEDPGQRTLSDRRQGMLCVCAALATYYGAALAFLLLHYGPPHGWAQVEPYLRVHLFDGFGCAALFALVFRHVRKVPRASKGTADSWADRFFKSLPDRRFLWAAAGLTAASAVIAAASVFVAGAVIWDVFWAGLGAAAILMGFWSGVAAGVALPVQAEQEIQVPRG